MRFNSSECMHCGFCLEACPTYRVSGAEDHSPRGRIQLIRAVEEGRLTRSETQSALDACLLCRACETACPSDVSFQTLLGDHREGYSSFLRKIFRRSLTSASSLKVLGAILRALRNVGILKLLEGAGSARLRALAQSVPRTATRFRPKAGSGLAATLPKRGKVGLHLGCVAGEFLGKTQRDLANLLRHQGFEVSFPRQPVCCGALDSHDGDRAHGKALAKQTQDAFDPSLDCVLSTSAGCTAHLQEHGFAQLREASEFLLAAGLRGNPESIAVRAVWDPPCHLAHTAAGPDPILRLLESVPGLTMLPLPEAELCCGAGGLSFLGDPSSADAVLARKVTHIRASGAQLCITANPGCQLRLEAGLRQEEPAIPVLHASSILAKAWGRNPQR